MPKNLKTLRITRAGLDESQEYAVSDSKACMKKGTR